MKIISMTATFGKLEGQTLDLHAGLNVIEAPNEWGKSTWCAFLAAMLYGVDTRERTTQEKLADKEKYMPWSGRPMEGVLRLEHQGRDITIQRRTRGRIPMGEFSAWETATGLPVRELTAENCGQVLLGVERSVFQRTGFVRFQDLPVTQDESLRRRLNGLVTTGDETDRADLLGKKLRELKNRCRYHRTGLIPEVQTQISGLEEQLREQQMLQQQMERLNQRIQETEDYLSELENHRDTLAYRQSQDHQRAMETASEMAETVQAELEELQFRCAGLPGREELQDKIGRGETLLAQLNAHQRRGNTSPVPVIAMWILTILVLAAGCMLLLCSEPVAGGVTLAAGVVLALVSSLMSRRRIDRETARMAEDMTIQERREAMEAALQEWRQSLRDLEELERIHIRSVQTRAQFQTMRAMARQTPPPRRPDHLTLSQDETMEEIGKVTELLRRSQIQLGQFAGRMENLPDREILQAGIDQARRRLTELEKTYLALDYAQKALEGAMQELQRRFAPRITHRAGEFVSCLTGGCYDRISIDENLGLSAARRNETALRTVYWRSEGTEDQLYLALRLAVWEVMTPAAPLVLDDAFVRFDRERLGCAMELLKTLSSEHQILLFTCQEREKEYL